MQHGMFCPLVPSHLSQPMSQPLLNPAQRLRRAPPTGERPSPTHELVGRRLRLAHSLTHARAQMRNGSTGAGADVQKHAWPLEPLSLRGSLESASGCAHLRCANEQQMIVSGRASRPERGGASQPAVAFAPLLCTHQFGFVNGIGSGTGSFLRSQVCKRQMQCSAAAARIFSGRTRAL